MFICWLYAFTCTHIHLARSILQCCVLLCRCIRYSGQGLCFGSEVAHPATFCRGASNVYLLFVYIFMHTHASGPWYFTVLCFAVQMRWGSRTKSVSWRCSRASWTAFVATCCTATPKTVAASPRCCYACLPCAQSVPKQRSVFCPWPWMGQFSWMTLSLRWSIDAGRKEWCACVWLE